MVRMEKVSAPQVRIHLGEILDRLERTGAPILISEGRKVRAVLITPEQFQRRFIDVRAAAERDRLRERIESLRKPKNNQAESVTVLRHPRGHDGSCEACRLRRDSCRTAAMEDLSSLTFQHTFSSDLSP